MKKVMLFLAMFLFSLSASAATLTLKGNDLNLLTFGPGSTVTDSGESVSLGGAPFGPFVHLYDLSSDTDGKINLKVTALPAAAKIAFSFESKTPSSSSIVVPFIADGLGGAVASYLLTAKANEVFELLIIGVSGALYTVEASVSAVPVPAAALLFAPALVGFVALRRKAVKAA